MSTAQIVERAWQLFCPICGAEPGARCNVPGSARAIHVGRTETARAMLDFAKGASQQRHEMEQPDTPCDTYERNHEEAAAEARPRAVPAPVEHPE